MKRKTVVLLSSVLAGALLVGGTFAAFAVTDLASPKGADYTPGPHEEPEETTYVTLEWGQGSVLTGIDQLENNELRKAGVVGLKSSTAYDGLFQVVISDKTPNTVVKGEEDPKLIDHFNVYVYEGKDANPETATLLGQLPDPAVQEDHQRELKLYLGGQNTADGHQVTVYVKIAGLSDEDFAKVSQDVVHLEVDWAMNDKDGESYHYDNKVVYFAKPAEFGAKMYAHSWNATSTTTWPGTEMALDAATGLYKVDVPANHTNIIFNDGEKKLPTEEDDPTGQGYLFAGYDLTKGYVYWDSTSWQMLPVNADVNLFSLEKNGQEVPASTLASYIVTDPIVKQDNNVVYDIELVADDVLEFSYDNEPIYFCTSNDLGQDVLVETEKTFDYAATYRFYINKYNHIFYEAKGQPAPLADYYLTGTFNDWKQDDTDYQFSVNPLQEGEYMGVFTLNAGDGIKVYGSEVYYPEGEGNEYVVQASGEHTIYFRPAGNPDWANNYFYVVEPVAPVVGYSATLNGQALDLSEKGSTYNPEKDSAAYAIELTKTDVLAFKYGEEVLNFCHWDEEQQKVVIDSQTYTPAEDGTYKFVINKSNEIFVEDLAPEGEGFAIYDVVEGKQIAALTYDGKEPGVKQRDQYVGNATLVKDQIIAIRDLKTAVNFTSTVEGWSFGGESEEDVKWQDYLEVVTGGWKVLQDVEVSISAKFAYEDDSIYFGLPQPAPIVTGYSATLNGQALDLSNKGQTYDPAENNAVYLLDLAANDVLAFKDGETDLHFYHWDKEQQKAIDEGTTFTVETAGQYDIYINTNNEIYVGVHAEPSTDGIYHLVGIVDWTYENGVPTTKIDDTHYQATGVQLAAGNTVKATDGQSSWLGVATPYDNCGYTVDKDGNAVIVAAGTYTVDVYTNGDGGNCLVFTKTA